MRYFDDSLTLPEWYRKKLGFLKERSIYFLKRGENKRQIHVNKVSKR